MQEEQQLHLSNNRKLGSEAKPPAQLDVLQMAVILKFAFRLLFKTAQTATVLRFPIISPQ